MMMTRMLIIAAALSFLMALGYLPAVLAGELAMVRVPGGCFQMGTSESEEGRSDNQRPHRVCVERFSIGKYEVTQGEWRAVMGNNPATFNNGNRYPVENISWDNIQDFISRLNAKTSQHYRLPTEAEWEYAARAGSTTAYYWGNSASHEHANYGKKPYGGLAQGKDRWLNTAPVGSFDPNAFGLHDTAGNVSEWTCSVYDKNYNGVEKRCTDQVGELEEYTHIAVRGGSWQDPSRGVRSASRGNPVAEARRDTLGFRLVRAH